MAESEGLEPTRHYTQLFSKQRPVDQLGLTFRNNFNNIFFINGEATENRTQNARIEI